MLRSYEVFVVLTNDPSIYSFDEVYTDEAEAYAAAKPFTVMGITLTFSVWCLEDAVEECVRRAKAAAEFAQGGR